MPNNSFCTVIRTQQETERKFSSSAERIICLDLEDGKAHKLKIYENH